jgi:hypothetical protein
MAPDLMYVYFKQMSHNFLIEKREFIGYTRQSDSISDTNTRSLNAANTNEGPLGTIKKIPVPVRLTAPVFDRTEHSLRTGVI